MGYNWVTKPLWTCSPEWFSYNNISYLWFRVMLHLEIITIHGCVFE